MEAFGIFEGGGAKGYAHIGALRASEERNIRFRAVAGTSIGAIFAVLVAVGYTSRELFNEADGLLSQFDPTSLLNASEWKDVRALSRHFGKILKKRAPSCFSPLYENAVAAFLIGVWMYASHRSLFKRVRKHYGATNVQPIHNWLDQALRAKLDIPEAEPICFRHIAKTPLKVIAADLAQQKIRVFGGAEDSDVAVVDAVLASASIPFVFQPRLISERYHVDGGMLSNHPAWVFDGERALLTKSVPTFGFKLTDALVDVPEADHSIDTFSSYLRSMFRTVLFGASELESRQIDDYYAIDLTADVGVLAFDEAANRGSELVEQGRASTERFFAREIGPRDPDEMNVGLSVISNELKRTLDLLKAPRVFVVREISAEFCAVTYSAGMEDDGDDRVRMRKSSFGPAKCFELREPIITRVGKIPLSVRANAMWKVEHTSRPATVRTVYSCPIFRDPKDWAQLVPSERDEPIAVLAFDTEEEISLKLVNPDQQDKIATLSQLFGEQLRGIPLTVTPGVPCDDAANIPDWTGLDSGGAFSVSGRKCRFLRDDEEVRSVATRIDERILQGRSARLGLKA